MATKTQANKATKATPATKKEATKRTPSLQSQVVEFVKAAGTKGTNAEGIASHLNLIQKDMDKSDRAKALKKVRVLARKAVGGASQTRNGRSAIYVIG